MNRLAVPLTPADAAGRSSTPARSQFDCLDAGYLPAFHSKSQQSADDVPAIVAARAGIHVNEAERLVPHDFQDVRSIVTIQAGRALHARSRR